MSICLAFAIPELSVTSCHRSFKHHGGVDYESELPENHKRSGREGRYTNVVEAGEDNRGAVLSSLKSTARQQMSVDELMNSSKVRAR